jgi:hypothetical protein
MSSLLHRLRAALAAEGGGVVMEVVVSALVFLTVAAGVTATLNAGTQHSGEQRTRAVAGNVATAEIERLRSLKFADLVDMIGASNTSTKDVAGTDYGLSTDIDWVGAPDISAAPCDVASRSPERLRLTVSVSWPNMHGRRPVSMSSLIAAPVSQNEQRGIVVVQVTNKDGFGVKDLVVTLAPTGKSAATDVNGCVRFSDLSPGPYNVLFSDPPKQTPDGITNVDQAVTVVGGQTQSLSFQYDLPAPAAVAFWYKDAAGARKDDPKVDYLTWRPTPTGALTEQLLSPTGNAATAPGGLGAGTFKVWAGRSGCANTEPPLAQTVANPGGQLEVQLPSARARVRLGSTNYSGITVHFIAPGTGACAKTVTAVSQGDGWTPAVALPYYATGDWSVCASMSGWKKTIPLAVRNYNAISEISFVDTSGIQPGSCP